MQQLEVGPDGAVYVLKDGKLHKLVNGKPPEGEWPKGSPGERMQYLDGWWFAHAWHGTIRRFAADLAPAPGVVLGGGSGSFIGHLVQNSELLNGRGMAGLDENLYAVSGLQGILHLVRWDETKQQFRIVRRIGRGPPAGESAWTATATSGGTPALGVGATAPTRPWDRASIRRNRPAPARR